MARWRLFAAACWQCKKDLPFEQDGPGRNKRFCSNKCRQKWYREMKKKQPAEDGPTDESVTK